MSTTTCTKCKRREAVFMRHYSGEKLCSRCFCRSIEEKVGATIAKYDMLCFDDRIALGISGGKDSMVLLHIMSQIEKSFPKAQLQAVIVDEGVKGYRDEALRIAGEGCRKLNVQHTVISFQELFEYHLDELVERLHKKKRHKGLTPCAYCGVLRRRALNIAAKKIGATKLATAHNLDDVTQTVLLNILHGDPMRIVKSKPISAVAEPFFVPRIKPFCEIPERETALYAYQTGIEFQGASCPYASTALRNDVRTMLNRFEASHPGIKFTVYHSAERLWSAIGTIEGLERMRHCKICGQPTSHQTCQPCKMLNDLR